MIDLQGKTKILFVIESFSGGGAEKVLSVLLKHFNYEEYEVTVCPIVDTGVYCEEVKKYVSHYVPVVSYRGNCISRLWNRIKYKLVYSVLPLKWVYDLFIPQGNAVEIAFCEGYVTKLLAHANSESKKIAWIHTDLRENPWPIQLGVFCDEKVEKDAYSVYDEIVCVSQTVEKSFHDKYGLNNTCTIYNPIDVDNIRKSAGEASHSPNDVMRMISIGRLVPQKGYDRLLRVVKRMHDEGMKFHLTILGEGQERLTLEQYVESNSMSGYVSLPGFLKNPYAELVQSDVFICSSRAEGFSLVIAEAMSLGIPVISTYCSGPNELLENGKYGVLVENSEDGLYNGIRTFLSSPCTNTLAAQKRIENEMHAEIVIKRIEKELVI